MKDQPTQAPRSYSSFLILLPSPQPPSCPPHLCSSNSYSSCSSSPAAAIPPPPPPPSAAAVAALTSTHVLSDDKQRCLKCFGSATKATMKEWWSTPCPTLFNVDGILKSPKQGERIHVMGAWAHESHTLNLHTSLCVWFCTRCGAIAEKQNRLLGKPCLGQTNKNRQEYLDRIAAHQTPKVLSQAEKKARRSPKTRGRKNYINENFRRPPGRG